MSQEVETVAAKVLAARCAEDVFGTVKTAAEVTRDFRAMARILHPDVAGPGDRPRDAMGALLRFRAEAERKMADGTWGQKVPAVAVEIGYGGILAGAPMHPLFHHLAGGEAKQLRVQEDRGRILSGAEPIFGSGPWNADTFKVWTGLPVAVESRGPRAEDKTWAA